MKCFRIVESAEGNKFISAECTPEEESACIEFRKKYIVRHVAETWGLYGMSQTETVISHHQHDAADEKLTCIFRNGELIGCRCDEREYYLNGKKSYSRRSGSGPQGPLIWDEDTWKLLERESKD